MKITIEFIEDTHGFIFNGWNVTQGDKYAEKLGYDEMLGLVSILTMPEKRPHLQWMKTKEDHEKSYIKNPNQQP